MFSSVVGSLISSAINYGGIFCLAYGIYLLAKKYPKLLSGIKVFRYFILLLAILIVQTMYNILFSINTSIITYGNFTSNQISITYFPVLIFTFMVGIVTLITTYYCTIWLNEIYGFFNPTKSYYYYGLLFCFGSILIKIGFLLLSQNKLPSSPLMTLGSESQTFGGILVVVALILQIIAGFKIYNRVNDLLMGKIVPRVYWQPYFNPNYPPKIPYQNQQLNYQDFNQNPELNPNKTYDTNSESIIVVNPSSITEKFCKNCGNRIPSESIFCQSCGAKID